MLPFDFYLPVRIHFGADKFEGVGGYLKGIGRKALIVTGKSSMNKLGVTDKLIELLQKAKIESVVFDEIEPNPRHTTIDKAASIVQNEGCDFVIGLGGGSVMDASKGVALSAKTGYSIWDFVYTGPEKICRKIEEALPIVCIPTIAATGSEADGLAVISNWETHEKTAIGGEALFPTVSIVDPKLTFTCPPDYTADGGVDIISHVMESYFTGTSEAYLQDRFSESVVKTVMKYLPRAIKDGNDLEARAHLSWCSSVALCGIVNSGRGGSFALHALEHALSGHYDISHGRGLAALFPSLMDYTMTARPEKYVEMGWNIFGLGFGDENIEKAAHESIEAMKGWLASIGRLLTLTDLGIDDSKFEAMADDISRIYMGRKRHLVNPRPIDRKGVIDIYRMAL